MTRYLLAAAFVVSAVLAPLAHADGQGAFIQGGAGRATQSHSGTAWGVDGGYRWTVANGVYLGAEMGYHDLASSKFRYGDSESFSDMSGTHQFASQGTGRVGTQAALLGANLRWDISDQLYAVVHGGLARYRTRTRTDGTSTIDTQSPSTFHNAYNVFDTRWYAGVGFGFDFTPQISLQFTYDHYPQHYSAYGYRYSNNLDVYGTAVEFRF
ncbi:outer membrane protein [Luteibacter sp.]|uniref:outer membrane protein n=1 Tax=Luteibacter sp. TaxID=1886636 RepID=UPI003F7E1E19